MLETAIKWIKSWSNASNYIIDHLTPKFFQEPQVSHGSLAFRFMLFMLEIVLVEVMSSPSPPPSLLGSCWCSCFGGLGIKSIPPPPRCASVDKTKPGVVWHTFLYCNFIVKQMLVTIWLPLQVHKFGWNVYFNQGVAYTAPPPINQHRNSS